LFIGDIFGEQKQVGGTIVVFGNTFWNFLWMLGLIANELLSFNLTWWFRYMMRKFENL
jgi:hypothetical protein